MSEPLTPNAQQLLLAELHHQAAAAIDSLHKSAKECPDPVLRANALDWLAYAGTRAAMRLHELALNPDRSEETRQAAARAPFWPKVIAQHKADQKAFDEALPAKIVGSDKLSLGNASLDTLQVRWVFSFIQAMDFGRAAWRHAEEEWEANDYLKDHHKITLDPEVLNIARQLTVLSPATLANWCDALKKYLAYHFPNHALGSHPEWLADAGQRISRDGDGLMRNNPKELHAFAVGRMVATLQQLIKPKRATRQRAKLVGLKRRK